MSLHHPLDIDVFDVLMINPTNPGANVKTLHTVGANERLEILSVTFQYASANAGAARMVMVAGYDGTDNFQQSPLADTVAVNTLDSLFFATNIDARDHEAAHDILTGKLATQLFLFEGDTLTVEVPNWNAGDEVKSIHIRAKRWITE